MQLSISLLCFSLVLTPQFYASTRAPANPETPPFRVVVVGLVHGHVEGFFAHYLNRPDLEVAGIYEPEEQLRAKYQSRYGFAKSMLFSDLDEMLEKTRPQAALIYTSTYDHRRAVETCARHGIPVMMEKPLAVSLEDARAIERSSRGKIPVLVNYETTWYRSNRAVYDLVQEKAIGDVRKIVVHDGHRGPKEIGVSPEFFAWLTDPKVNGAGALFDFGCYGADLATWLMNGQAPTTVTAVTEHIKPDVYPRVEDEATVVLTYPKAQAIIQASWNWPFDRKDIEVYGETGYALTVRRDDVRVRRREGQEEQVAAKPLPPPEEDPISYLRAIVSRKVQPGGLSSLETNIVVMEILDAARSSAASGRTVRLGHE